MVHCSQCKKHLYNLNKSNTGKYSKNQQVFEIGDASIWMMSRSGGWAFTYCEECYQIAVKDYCNINLKDSKGFMQRNSHSSSTMFEHDNTVDIRDLNEKIRQATEKLEAKAKVIGELEQENQKLRSSEPDKEGLRKEMEELRQLNFNISYQQEKSQAQLQELNYRIEKNKPFLEAFDDLEDLHEFVRGLPRCIKESLAERDREFRHFESELLDSVVRLSRETVSKYRAEINSLIEGVKAKKERELKALEQIRDRFKKNAEQSNMFSEKEINNSLSVTTAKIEQKMAQLAEFRAGREEEQQSSCWIMNSWMDQPPSDQQMKRRTPPPPDW